MQVWQDPQDSLIYRMQVGMPATALTIGNFDGVHRGHQELLRRVTSSASQRGLYSMLLTFHPHPLKILVPDGQHTRIFSLEDQQEQLAFYGLQGVLRQPFSRQFSEISATEFLENYLLKYFRPQLLVVGHDFEFGAHRSGDLRLLQKFCDDRSITLEAVPPLKIAGEVVSTSRIRYNLSTGNLAQSEAMLGRKYYLKGIVEKGEMRGRQIGFPTANIRPDVDFYPKMGVYVCQVLFPDLRYLKAVMNVGMNKTFVEGDHNPIKAEVHVLDFSGDLYGHTLKVELCHFLREEIKFPNVNELRLQIERDILKAREILR